MLEISSSSEEDEADRVCILKRARKETAKQLSEYQRLINLKESLPAKKFTKQESALLQALLEELIEQPIEDYEFKNIGP